MMGESDPHRSMFYNLSLESFVPAEHPLRRIRPLIDDRSIRRACSPLYSEIGRRSVPKLDRRPISRCFAVVVVQKSAESLTPREGTATSGVAGSRDEPTAQALVRPFFVVVRHVLAHELSEMCLSQRNHAVEALLLNRTVEPLDERIQVRAAPGQTNRLDTGPRETCTKFPSEDRIAVHDQVVVWQQEPVRRRSDCA